MSSAASPIALWYSSANCVENTATSSSEGEPYSSDGCRQGKLYQSEVCTRLAVVNGSRSTELLQAFVMLKVKNAKVQIAIPCHLPGSENDGTLVSMCGAAVYMHACMQASEQACR